VSAILITKYAMLSTFTSGFLARRVMSAATSTAHSLARRAVKGYLKTDGTDYGQHVSIN
jgi:hypothetical protein